MKILVLEDNLRLSHVIRTALEQESYKVDCFYDGDDALNALENGYSCFILDINVPNLDGISVLKSIRLKYSSTPVIIISSNHEFDKIQTSYEVGCNDYIKKPFFIVELVHKVKKLCVLPKIFLKFSDSCKYDFISHRLFENEEEFELTKKEILFLDLFSKNIQHIATYEEVEEYVWEGEETTLANIRSMIKRLRKKLPPASIIMVKGIGYSLNKNVSLS